MNLHNCGQSYLTCSSFTFQNQSLICGDKKEISNISHMIIDKVEEFMRSKRVKSKKKTPSDMSLIGYQIILTQSLLIKQEVDLLRKHIEPVLSEIMILIQNI